jgi:hypothetical protein
LIAVNGQQSAGLIPASLLGIAGTYPALATYINQHLKANVSKLFECTVLLLTNPSYGYDPVLEYDDMFGLFENSMNILSDQAPLLSSMGAMGLHDMPAFPLFVFNGTADEITVDIKDTDDLVPKYYAAVTKIQYLRLDGATHSETVVLGFPYAVDFLTGLCSGNVPTTCSTTNLPA